MKLRIQDALLGPTFSENKESKKHQFQDIIQPKRQKSAAFWSFHKTFTYKGGIKPNCIITLRYTYFK